MSVKIGQSAPYGVQVATMGESIARETVDCLATVAQLDTVWLATMARRGEVWRAGSDNVIKVGLWLRLRGLIIDEKILTQILTDLSLKIMRVVPNFEYYFQHVEIT